MTEDRSASAPPSRLHELADLIVLCNDAHANYPENCAAGIALDDFVIEHGDELVAALRSEKATSEYLRGLEEAALVVARRNAERYRWLMHLASNWHWRKFLSMNAEEIEAVIDAALKNAAPQGITGPELRVREPAAAAPLSPAPNRADLVRRLRNGEIRAYEYNNEDDGPDFDMARKIADALEASGPSEEAVKIAKWLLHEAYPEPVGDGIKVLARELLRLAQGGKP